MTGSEVFLKEGNTKAALRLLFKIYNRGAILSLNNNLNGKHGKQVSVLDVLKSKHPPRHVTISVHWWMVHTTHQRFIQSFLTTFRGKPSPLLHFAPVELLGHLALMLGDGGDYVPPGG